MDNNLYYQPNINDSTSVIQLTKDGEHNLIFNGVPDWLYEGKIKIIDFKFTGTLLFFQLFYFVISLLINKLKENK